MTVAAIAAIVGLVLGLVAGFAGGVTDAVLSRVTDMVLAFPTMVVVIVLAGMFGPSLVTLIVALALLEWTVAFRIVRGMTLSIRERDAVIAVQGLGGRRVRILGRHILPEVLGQAVVVATLLVAQSILLETTLSFLGLGFPPDIPTWGRLLFDAKDYLDIAPHWALFAGAAIFLTVLAINFIGDGLRDALDPRKVM